MCEQTEHVRPSGCVVVQVHGKNLFEVALFAEHGDVPGEIPLTKRFCNRFGHSKVRLRKDGPAAAVIQITSDPVANPRGLEFFADLIARVASQHYGDQIEVTIVIRHAPLCQPRGVRTSRMHA